MKDQHITLEGLLKIIFKNAILIIILALVGGGSFYLIAKHKQSKSYVAERSLVIDHNLEGRQARSLFETDLNMVPTYRDMIEGREVTTNAYHRLPKKIKHDTKLSDLSSSIDTNSRPSSLVITIKATTDNPKNSVAYVNSVAEAAKIELPKMQRGIGEVHVYSKANQKNVAVVTHSSVKKYTLVGIALGIIAGMVISFSRVSFKYVK